MKNETMHFFVAIFFFVFFSWNIVSWIITGGCSRNDFLWGFGIQFFWLIAYIISNHIVSKMLKVRETKENGAI